MSNKDSKYKLYLFALALPFLSLLTSVRFFKSPSARNLFWYGCIFMGYIHIFNPIGGTANDGVRYAEALVTMHIEPVDIETLSGYFYSEDGHLDIYQPLVTFLLSLFTGNPHILFMVFATVFGFFYSRNIWMALHYSEKDKIGWWVWVILIMLMLIRPIWEINGVRMYTALQVFMYGVFSFYLMNDKKKLIWSFLSVFIHFSFIFPVALLVIFFFLPKKNLTIYFVFYFLAVIFNEIDIQSLKDGLVDILPARLSEKAVDYMNEDYLEVIKERNATYSLYLKIADKMFRYFSFLAIFFLWLKKQSFLENKTYRNLLVLTMFTGAVFEILSGIPSMIRFLDIPNLIFYTLLFLLLSDKQFAEHKIHKMVKITSVALILPILLRIRIGLEFYGISLLCGNFVSASIINDNIPLISFVKSLFY